MFFLITLPNYEQSPAVGLTLKQISKPTRRSNSYKNRSDNVIYGH